MTLQLRKNAYVEDHNVEGNQGMRILKGELRERTEGPKCRSGT